MTAGHAVRDLWIRVRLKEFLSQELFENIETITHRFDLVTTRIGVNIKRKRDREQIEFMIDGMPLGHRAVPHEFLPDPKERAKLILFLS